ncbi:MAG: TetR/AcrR family transcriptional regulator [Lentimicrobium sp.]|nr:TetR/AcrR family transcriptional regulator [Lentimicrobium sp.]
MKNILATEELNTEELILRAAKKIFTHKGFEGARMKDIADEAGINKALLHYYFRSKDKLFESIFDGVLKSFLPQAILILSSELPLFQKIDRISEYYIQSLSKQPDIPIFVLHELSVNPYRLIENIKEHGMDLHLFSQQLQSEIDEGKIRPIKTAHFITNLFALCVFPFIGRPLIMGMMNLNDTEFNSYVLERRQIVTETMIRSLKV